MSRYSARAVLAVASLVGVTACGPRTAPAPAPGPATPSDVSAEQIERSASSKSLDRMLQGRVSGVIVESVGNGGIAVRIRGSGSFYGSNEPLYLVDGAPFTPGPNGALTGVNPHDIESIHVLKNPADTAIYGMRGANGVVVIKTKAPGGR